MKSIHWTKRLEMTGNPPEQSIVLKLGTLFFMGKFVLLEGSFAVILAKIFLAWKGFAKPRVIGPRMADSQSPRDPCRL